MIKFKDRKEPSLSVICLASIPCLPCKLILMNWCFYLYEAFSKGLNVGLNKSLVDMRL